MPNTTRRKAFGTIVAMFATGVWITLCVILLDEFHWKGASFWHQLDFLAVVLLMFTTLFAGLQWAIDPPDSAEFFSLRVTHLLILAFVFIIGIVSVKYIDHPKRHIAAILCIYIAYLGRWWIKKYVLGNIDEFDNNSCYFIDVPSTLCFILLLAITSNPTELLEATSSPHRHTLQELYVSGAVFFHLIVSSVASFIMVIQCFQAEEGHCATEYSAPQNLDS